MNSAFVPISVSTGRASPIASAATAMPYATATMNAVCATRDTPSSSFAPSRCAMTEFTPAPRPINSPVNSATYVVVEPTAPSAPSGPNRPTTATSDILNSTCSTLESMSGRLNRSIFFTGEPEIIDLLFSVNFSDILHRISSEQSIARGAAKSTVFAPA